MQPPAVIAEVYTGSGVGAVALAQPALAHQHHQAPQRPVQLLEQEADLLQAIGRGAQNQFVTAADHRPVIANERLHQRHQLLARAALQLNYLERVVGGCQPSRQHPHKRQAQ